MNGVHDEHDDLVIKTLAVKKEDSTGKEFQREYFSRMLETTECANNIIKRYIGGLTTKIGDTDLQDFLLRITNRRAKGKPSLIASLIRNSYECAAPGSDWQQHAELIAAAEMKANAYYFANWFYDGKFLQNPADNKQAVNASLITKPLADKIILDWAAKSSENMALLPRIMELFVDSDIYTEIAQRMDIFNNVYDNQKDKPIEEQIRYSMDRTEKLAQYYKNAVRLGGALANISPEQAQALEDFGRNFGIAGQITNDIADYSMVQHATFAKQYKDTFSDFKGKKMTLPLIFALDKANGRERNTLKGLLEQDIIQITDTDTNEVYNIMTNCGAFDASKKCAVSHSNFAQAALRKHFNKDARRMLTQAAVMPKCNKYYTENLIGILK